MTKLKLLAAMLAAPAALCAQTHINLSDSFDSDVFLEPGGIGLGDPLGAEGQRIDAGTLPEGYTEGSAVTAQNGRATYQFGPLLTESLDALRIDGQTIDVEDGSYSSIDLALVSAPGAFVNPFAEIEFVYADGSSSGRLGPVAGWFSSPTVYDNAIFHYTDQSGVTEHVAFATDGEEDFFNLYQSANTGISGGWRFADGNGYMLYWLDTTGIESANLGVTIGNNFVISVASDYIDPSITTEGYTVLASSMDIYGVDHHALGNLREYTFDVSEYLDDGTGILYVLLTDGSPADGWGPFVQRIRLFEGEAIEFNERLQPVVDASDAEVHANFQIASAEETPFLFNNSGAGPSNRGHRFADANGSLTYRFDLPDDVTEAKMTVDMENNFVVSLAGPPEGTTFARMTPNTPEEAEFLIDAGGSATQPSARFADGAAFMIYEFDLPDDTETVFARVHVGNQFVIEAAAGAEGEYSVLKDYYFETGDPVMNMSNLDYYTLDISSFLADNPSKVVRIRLTDGIPTDGWGPYLRGIEIIDSEDAGALNYTEVLNSMTLFGEDVHNESNRDYYTVDLSSVLGEENPGREVYVRFTDGSTADGWGPSLYWMSVYSGEIEIHTDSLVFPGLKTTFGEPFTRPLGLLSRNYPLDPSKTLTAIQFPAHPEDQSSSVYLLAATLNEAAEVVAPELDITGADANRVRISWPTAAGFTLQFAPSLAEPIEWTDASATPEENGGTTSVEIDITGNQGYFRLAQ